MANPRRWMFIPDKFYINLNDLLDEDFDPPANDNQYYHVKPPSNSDDQPILR